MDVEQCTKPWTWSTLLWVLGTFCLPVTIPWLIFKYLRRAQCTSLKQQLIGKVVLITGASSGLGEALAHSFFKAGCRIILASRREDELNRVKKSLMESHSTTPTYPPVVLPLDLSNLDELHNSVQKIISMFGQIDILINNGGITHRGAALSTKVEVDMRVMMVNYFGTIAITKAILPSMVQKKNGHIIVISSIQGLIGIPHRSAYAASKHALQGFFDSLRAEVADDNVKVTMVSPGYIQTKLSLNALRGDGNTHGVMDSNTANGFPADMVAEKILNSILLEEKELVISTLSPRIAIFLRKWLPSLYFFVMQRRARNSTD